MLRYFTAGESHGEALSPFSPACPPDSKIDQAFVDRELWRRQQGYGRGGRMKIERDTAHILSGVRHGKPSARRSRCSWKIATGKTGRNLCRSKPEIQKSTSASPLLVPAMPISPERLKYNFPEARYVLERASARESAARVAIGALAKLFLRALGIEVLSHVVTTGSVTLSEQVPWEKIQALYDQRRSSC